MEWPLRSRGNRSSPPPGQPGLPLSDDAPLLAALQQLVVEFAAAPVRNPDGTTGITLHVDAGPLSVAFPSGNYANGRPLREGGDLITESQGTGRHIDVVYYSPTNNDPNDLINGVVSRSFDSINWANIRMDFQDDLANLGNTFGLNGNSTV